MSYTIQRTEEEKILIGHAFQNNEAYGFLCFGIYVLQAIFSLYTAKTAKVLSSIAMALMLGIAATKAESTIYINDGSGNLGTVDAADGSVNVIGNTGAALTDIAFDSNGNLYGLSFYNLYSIDPSTTSATLIGRHGIAGGNALTFGSDGTLYGAGNASTFLYTIDLSTGAGTAIGDMGYTSDGDLAFNNGNLYLASTTGELVQINLSSDASGTAIGMFGIVGVFGMATENDGILYGASGTQLFSIDTSIGTATSVVDYGGQGLGISYGSSSYTSPGSSFQTDLAVTSIDVSDGNGGIPIQAEPSVFSINISNAGENPLNGEISIFIEIADLENQGFADMPFSGDERINGAALFQYMSFQTNISLPPGSSDTVVVGNDPGELFAFLSSAYSDRVRVTVRFPGDKNAANDTADNILPDGWPMPNSDLGANCVDEIAAVLLAPAAGVQKTAVKVGKTIFDWSMSFLDVISYTKKMREGDIPSAAETLDVALFDMGGVLVDITGTTVEQNAFGILSEGWALINAGVNESQFLGCGEAFSISWGIGKEIAKDIIQRKADASSQSAGLFGFFAGSPVNLIVEDASGQTTSVTHDVTTAEGIPDSFAYMLDVDPKPKAVVVVGNSEYTLRMVGVDQGTTNLYIIQSMSDGSLKGIKFSNIATTSSSIATVSLNENTEAVALSLDIDGDGAIDEIKSPDLIESLSAASSSSNNSSVSDDTGSSGGGCSISQNAALDPLFPLLIAWALAYLIWQRYEEKSK